MNTLNKDINITIRVVEDGYIVFDDTQTKIDFILKNDVDTLLEVVSGITEGRINGTEPSSLW